LAQTEPIVVPTWLRVVDNWPPTPMNAVTAAIAIRRGDKAVFHGRGAELVSLQALQKPHV
jgi:hypothetical protein